MWRKNSVLSNSPKPKIIFILIYKLFKFQIPRKSTDRNLTVTKTVYYKLDLIYETGTTKE